MNRPITHSNLTAVVVWYNPTKDHASNLQSYLEQVRQVIVVDNSTVDNRALLQAYGDKTHYIYNGENLGIATALNRGFQKAIELQAEWVLTMDQDSRFEPDDFARFISVCDSYEGQDKTGIFSPLQVYGDTPRPDLPAYERRVEVMTSGNLVRAEAYRQAGGFRDDFFIDLVDEEFCLRINKAGYDIIMANDIRLRHNLGHGYVKTRVLRHRFIDHPPMRYYYITRNTLMTIHLFPERKQHYKKQLKKRIKRLILYVRRQKGQKLLMSWRGFRDYRKKRMGRYEDIYR